MVAGAARRLPGTEFHARQPPFSAVAVQRSRRSVQSPFSAGLTIFNAHQINLPRPGLNTSEADSERILSRYSGPPVTEDGNPNLPALQYGR